MGKKKPPPVTPERDVRNNPFAALAPGGATPDETPKAEAKASVEPADAFRSKLVLRREKKGRGGKTITRVSGVSHDALQDVAKRMKKSLGCGALVEGEDIVLLGSLVDRAADWLEKQGAAKIVRGN